MQTGKPVLALPGELALGAGLAKRLAIVRPAMPKPAAHSAGESVFRCHQQQLAARLKHACQFAQSFPFVCYVVVLVG